MQKKYIQIVLLIITTIFYSQSYSQIPGGYEKGLSTISKDEMKENLTFLASDSLQGRMTGENGNLLAAMLIAKKFKEYSLKPLFTPEYPVTKTQTMLVFNNDDEESDIELDINDVSEYDDYFQKFVMKKSKISDSNKLTLTKHLGNSTITKDYNYQNDFLIQYDSPENINLTAPIVFAGYGIANGENGYNDYSDQNGKDIDVKNKIVMIFDGYPQYEDSTSSFFKTRNSYYKNILRKADVAVERGALALIVASSPFKNDPPVNIKYEKLNNSFSKSKYSLPGLKRSKIPVFYVNTDILLDIFSQSGKSYKDILQRIEDSLKTEAFEFENNKITLEIKFNSELIKTQNVIGFLPGTDPKLKDECIIIGGHFDHVGLGEYGSMNSKEFAGQVHNGADDNGSGTCSVIELAEAFSKNPPKRSVLFIGFTAEELGLYGSRYYAYQQPVFPLNKTVAMLNLDMIGRNSTDLVYVGGAFYSPDLIKIAERANEQIGFELLYNLGLLNNASDQAPFYRKEIPALFFFSGVHDDYHTPADDVDKINFEKLDKVTRLAYLTGWIAANEDSKPAFEDVNMERRAEIVKESLARHKKYKELKGIN